ncbi:MAG TPA: acyl carrier protein [Acidimicrobiales bacterium]|nr:acyl carrier protein [Acidimicrobiales bacterium]
MNKEDVFATLRDVAVEVLGAEPDAVVEGASFKDDLDADSLDLVEVVMALEERLDIAVPEEDLEGIGTVGDALTLLLDKLAAKAS